MRKFILIISALLFVFCTKQDVVSTSINNNKLSANSIQSSDPNILLIIADDMGLDATPGYSVGSVKPNMPNLQNMIANGVSFQNLWSYPTCTPTRSSIITGKYGFRTDVMRVGDVLSTSETSLQTYLDDQNSGYSHAVIGKWHLAKGVKHPNRMGVDYYAGLLKGTAPSYTNWTFTENQANTNSTDYITTKFTDLAINWVQQQSSPWFLWLAYTAPHTPFHVPPSNLHSQGNLPSDQASINANPLPYYMAAMEAMDTEISRLLSSMSQAELDNTIIIFIGDNGSPGSVSQDYPSGSSKGSLYQGGVNVPMVVSGANVNRLNDTEDALINTTDLFATITDLAGTNTSQINDSYSFKELLSSTTSSLARDYAYTEYRKPNGNTEYTIRNTTHKYILFANGNEALYNLQSDFFETNNLLDNLPLSASDQQQLTDLQAEASSL